MSGIRCFMIEPTDDVRRFLRRTSPDSNCPVGGGWHRATSAVLDRISAPDHSPEAIGGMRDWPHDDPRWPARCDTCGVYEFDDNDWWLLDIERIWIDSATNAEMHLRDAAPGAMYYADWLTYHDEPGLCVVLPNGLPWAIDARANNCTRPDDNEHHCWCRHGTPPDVTVDKECDTCAAGAGSIAAGDYHGFLRNGELVTA